MKDLYILHSHSSVKLPSIGLYQCGLVEGMPPHTPATTEHF